MTNLEIKIEKQRKKFERGEKIKAKIGQSILLILLVAFVYLEIKEIYATMTGTNIVTVVLAHADTAVVVSPIGSSVIETKQAVKSQESSSQPGIEDMIRKTFPEAPECAVAVAKCESQLDPSRIGDKHMEKYSYGLFQINQTWHPYSQETLLNPKENVRIAKEIYDSFEKRTGDGFNAWTCYKQNLYLKYL